MMLVVDGYRGADWGVSRVVGGCGTSRGGAADFGGYMVRVGVEWVSRLSYIRYLILRQGVVGSLGIMRAFIDGLGRWWGLLFCEALHDLS